MWRAKLNDLRNSNRAAADGSFTEPPPEIRKLIERSAHLVVKRGLEMEKRFMRFSQSDPKFNFMRSSHPFHALYKLKVTEYSALNPDGPQLDAPATTHEYVRVHMAPPFKDLPQPRNPPIFELSNPPQGITLKEIGTIMLTAQFVARYGMYFLAGLMKRVSMNPQFEFMKETDSRYHYFTQLVVAYSRVVYPSQKLSERPLACLDTLFQDFFNHLQLENLEDLLAFVGGVDYFARMENEESCASVPPPQHFSMLMNPPPQMQPPLGPKAQLPPPCMDDSVPVKIIVPCPLMRRMIEKTALLVSQEGLEIERAIRDCKVGDKLFNFLRSSDPSHAFYQHKLNEFSARKQDGPAPDILPDLPPFIEKPIFPVGKPPEGITPKELGIMKLTAQFATWYGMYFTLELMKRGRGMTRNLFDFLEMSDTRRNYFSRLVIAYTRVLRRTKKLMSERGDCPEPVLEAFFKLVQLEKLEEGGEMAVRDVCAFVGGVEYFALVEEEGCMGNEEEEDLVLGWWRMMQPPPEEPESKRPNLDG